MQTKLQHQDYNSKEKYYQLFLPINYEVLIAEKDSVRLLNKIMEELDYRELYKEYSARGRKPKVEPKTMCKILVYSYMEGEYSSRGIEKACKRDVNYMWLLQGEEAPDHTTINRFRKDKLGKTIDGLFCQVVKKLCEIGEIEFETVFIDGTKIEAFSNRYTFVWKKAIEKNEEKMHLKIKELATEMENLYGREFEVTEEKIDENLYVLIKYLEDKMEIDGIEMVEGSGKKQSNEQKLLKKLKEYRERQGEYDLKKDILGERNSYSKTDPDASFMRLKDDHMQNGQLKPAYNVQMAVEGEYVTGLGIYQISTDTTTLIPLLESMKEKLGVQYKNIVADAGYESEENYTYLEEKGMEIYIKPQVYERQKKRSFKKEIGKRENMDYDEESDEYTCHNGKKLRQSGTYKKKTKTGFETNVTVYECESCEGCPFKGKGKGNCSWAKGNRKIEVSKRFIRLRKKSHENITSEQGKVFRVNRSIQSEGAFGVIKSNRKFERFLTRGRENVTTETYLLCFAHNIKKLHAKIQSGRCGKILHEIESEII